MKERLLKFLQGWMVPLGINQTVPRERGTLRRQRSNPKAPLPGRKTRLATLERVLKESGILRRQRSNLKAQLSALKTRLTNLQKQFDHLLVNRSLFDSLRSGEDVDRALSRWTRKHAKLEAHRIESRTLAHSLSQSKFLGTVGTLCTAIHAVAEGFPEAGLRTFEKLPRDMVLANASGEYFQALLENGHSAANSLAEDILRGTVPADASALLICAKAAVGSNRLDWAELFARKASESSHLLDTEEIQTLDWMLQEFQRRALDRTKRTLSPHGEVAIGLIDYKMLDYKRTSSNLGDYVQTLAMVSNLVRFCNARYFSETTGIAELLTELSSAVRPEAQIKSPSPLVRIETLHRDAASAKHFKHPVWLVAFGWYMHPEFRRFYDFPFDENVRPLFISFHINDRAMLNERAIDYLNRYAPIGCRDWSTVYILREFGIPAFFSGCITTTLGKLFSPIGPAVTRQGTAFVDSRPSPGDPCNEATISTQVGKGVKDGEMVINLKQALEMLHGYRKYRRVVTSRLHCYLPCRALGLDVEFRPKTRADVRFEGLLDLDEASFQAIKTGIEEKLEAVLAKILSGANEGEVYQQWNRACSTDLEHAERHCSALEPLPPPSFHPRLKAKELSDRAQISDCAADSNIPVAFACDAKMADILPVAMESAWRNCSRRLHFHVMMRGLPQEYHHRLERDFGRVAELTTYDFDSVDFGDKLKMLAHTTVSTMDRLLLPDLLTGLPKALYLDADVVVLGDLTELWETDISSFRLAGKASNYHAWKHVYKLVGKSAATLEPEKAWQLRRRLSAKSNLQGRAFNAGVLVLNLERMRRESFAETHIPLIEQYAMNDQDALNVYAAGEWSELPQNWNSVPAQDDTAHAKLLHFAGKTKPWHDTYIVRKEDFLFYKKLHEQRTAEISADSPSSIHAS